MKNIGAHCTVRSVLKCGALKVPVTATSGVAISRNSPIHDSLCCALDRHGLIGYVREFAGSIHGRKFRLDIAYPDRLLGIEVDGWQSHGKTKAGFQKDREKQNLYVLSGWRILRYTASDIHRNIDSVIKQIEEALQMPHGLELSNFCNMTKRRGDLS